MSLFPDYLRIPAADLGRGTAVKIRVVEDAAALGRAMADDILAEISYARKKGRAATLIVPVGPVEAFPVLAEKVKAEGLSLQDVMLINMDEYLTDDDAWVPLDHPLSFRAFMNRLFYEQLPPALAPRPENRVFPDPAQPALIQKRIDARGGVDLCCGGIGINGHLAFNEPPEPGVTSLDNDFAALPTRNLTLSRETRTINSVTVGGDITVIPKRAVTVGMKEILAARRVRIYCNRPWQRAVMRRVLHGPITAACPASFIRNHPDATLTLTREVAALPEIRLR
jgi:glucosamine-6-phosphate deaminase